MPILGNSEKTLRGAAKRETTLVGYAPAPVPILASMPMPMDAPSAFEPTVAVVLQVSPSVTTEVDARDVVAELPAADAAPNAGSTDEARQAKTSGRPDRRNPLSRRQPINRGRHLSRQFFEEGERQQRTGWEGAQLTVDDEAVDHSLHFESFDRVPSHRATGIALTVLAGAAVLGLAAWGMGWPRSAATPALGSESMLHNRAAASPEIPPPAEQPSTRAAAPPASSLPEGLSATPTAASSAPAVASDSETVATTAATETVASASPPDNDTAPDIEAAPAARAREVPAPRAEPPSRVQASRATTKIAATPSRHTAVAARVAIRRKVIKPQPARLIPASHPKAVRARPPVVSKGTRASAPRATAPPLAVLPTDEEPALARAPAEDSIGVTAAIPAAELPSFDSEARAVSVTDRAATVEPSGELPSPTEDTTRATATTPLSPSAATAPGDSADEPN